MFEIKDALKGAVCEKAVQALIYIDEQHVQQVSILKNTKEIDKMAEIGPFYCRRSPPTSPPEESLLLNWQRVCVLMKR